MSPLDPSPALVTGPAALAAGGLLVWLAVARRSARGDRLQITPDPLVLEPAVPVPMPVPAANRVGARAAEPRQSRSSHIALSAASGVDRILHRVLGRGSRDANAAAHPNVADASGDPGPIAEGTTTSTAGASGEGGVSGSLEAVSGAAPDSEGAPSHAAQAQRGDVGVDTADGSPDVRDECARDRRLVRERSALVARARAVNQDVLEGQRRLQRDYDAATASAQAAADVMDGRRVLGEKEAAQRRFRAARTAARSASDVEDAATRWLAAINDLNVRVHDAQRTVAAERRRATRLVAEIEAGGYRVDAARIALEAAEEKAQLAREALAACEELQGARRAAASMASRAPVAHAARSAAGAPLPSPPEAGGVPDRDMAQPRSYLVEILHGDEGALGHVVAALAPDSAEDARRWHLELCALRDALVAAAIDAALVDPPRDHPFWSAFSADDAREIAVALSSLGYRYDGRGAFLDGRLPSARDLALAIGYARMDPRRIRRWPSPAEIPQLLDGAHVAVEDFVIAGAPDLTLGQMVGLLGPRAPGLTTLWDQWGRVRPLLAAAAR